MTEHEIIVGLSEKYKAPEYAFLPQVRSTTGYGAVRTADALAMSLWPSRGLELYGFEIKTARSDWLRELKEPSKAETIFQHCHRWYIVTDKDIVRAGELPPTWGLITAKGKGFAVEVAAPLLSPCPFTPAFMAAILRKATEVVIPQAEIVIRLENARKQEREIAAANLEATKRRLEKQYEGVTVERDHLQGMIREFQEASGVYIDRYKAGKIGEAVRAVLRADIAQTRESLKGLEYSAQQILRSIQDTLADLPKAPAEVQE